MISITAIVRQQLKNCVISRWTGLLPEDVPDPVVEATSDIASLDVLSDEAVSAIVGLLVASGLAVEGEKRLESPEQADPRLRDPFLDGFRDAATIHSREGSHHAEALRTREDPPAQAGGSFSTYPTLPPAEPTDD